MTKAKPKTEKARVDNKPMRIARHIKRMAKKAAHRLAYNKRQVAAAKYT